MLLSCDGLNFADLSCDLLYNSVWFGSHHYEEGAWMRAPDKRRQSGNLAGILHDRGHAVCDFVCEYARN